MKKLLSLISCLLLLGACAEVELASHAAKHIPGNSTQQGTFKVGNSYEVMGKTYHPEEQYQFVETGMASWYGPNFNGKRTANGETFDMRALTAAHKTLQMPSIIRVTNLENGRSAILRVNDRGPFSKKRVLDVSKGAAQKLGMIQNGTARVKIELMPRESRQVAALAKQGRNTAGFEVALNQRNYAPQAQREPITTIASREPVTRVASAQTVLSPVKVDIQNIAPASGTDSKNIYVQAAAFKDEVKARQMVDSLGRFGQAHIQSALVNGQEWYRVRFGPMRDSQSADMLSTKLGDSGRANAIVIID